MLLRSHFTEGETEAQSYGRPAQGPGGHRWCSWQSHPGRSTWKAGALSGPPGLTPTPLGQHKQHVWRALRQPSLRLGPCPRLSQETRLLFVEWRKTQGQTVGSTCRTQQSPKEQEAQEGFLEERVWSGMASECSLWKPPAQVAEATWG